MQACLVLQEYQAHVYDEYVIHGNTAVFRCQVPDFMKEFLTVTSWTRDDGLVIVHHKNAVHFWLQESLEPKVTRWSIGRYGRPCEWKGSTRLSQNIQCSRCWRSAAICGGAPSRLTL
ncbi:hypothetical protein AVEN_73214-1 [Araneus ventricosus]|uniref:Ig-like domain-containing protein n=1 Tax=Araneus ventricosus TaxID=182803 RepID=A0A4Y2HMX6_ARAVE|nr:hypothetical protein AVEN_73214-1 [Araneus ventricosus]